jgi:uncharacterized membrane protein YkvA (DUF1232 family)
MGGAQTAEVADVAAAVSVQVPVGGHSTTSACVSWVGPWFQTSGKAAKGALAGGGQARVPGSPAMRQWLVWPGIAVGLMVMSWAVLILLARRLPPGPLRELARFIPDCVTTIRRLRRDPRVPRRARVAVVLAGLWVASPVDLIPEFLPVIGPLDDVVVVALALRYAARQLPRQVLLDAWPGETGLLERLIGPARPAR